MERWLELAPGRLRAATGAWPREFSGLGNDAAVDRMCSSIREFGFKVPCLVRSDGEVVDGIAEIPVIRCDEWTLAQVKRSDSW